MIADFAEFYHIYEGDHFSLLYLATLAGGLDPDSRSIRALSKQKVKLNSLLLAGIADRLGMILWSWSKEAEKGKQPLLLLDILQGDGEEGQGFSSGKEFEEKRKGLLRRLEKGGA